MDNLNIISKNMKGIIILCFCFSLLFAITPVPKDSKEKHKTKKPTKIEILHQEIKKSGNYKTEKNKESGDRFQDADSNSINDSREDDLQKIKWLKTKFKDLLKKKPKKSK